MPLEAIIMPDPEIRNDKAECAIPSLSCMLAELIGTFVLTFADAGVGVAAVLSPGIPLAARAIAPGLAVLAMIFALGELSGAHINPAVTFAFALRGVFPWKRVFAYWILQLTGASCAALLLWAIFGVTGDVGATLPIQGAGPAFVFEIVLTFMLAMVIISTSHQSKVKGPQAAFPVGATIAVCGLVGKAISGASMNPARSFGPALFSSNLDSYWIYALAPLLGASIAVGAIRLLFGPADAKELESAQGEKNLKGTRSRQKAKLTTLSERPAGEPKQQQAPGG
jgi:MIP family channel proteins